MHAGKYDPGTSHEEANRSKQRSGRSQALVKRTTNYALFSYIFDMVATVAALLFADTLFQVQSAAPVGDHISLILLGMVLTVWTVTFFLFSIYDTHNPVSFLTVIRRLLLGNMVAMLVLLGTLYLAYVALPRELIASFLILNVSILVGWRVIVRVASLMTPVRNRPAQHRVLVVGANDLGHQITEIIKQTSGQRTEVYGYLDDEKLGSHGELPIIGGLDDVADLVAQFEIDEVVVALPHNHYESLNQIILTLQPLPVHVRIVPSYLSLALYRPSVGDLGGLPLISLSEPALTATQRIMKRTFDIMISASILIAVSPIMTLIALAIKLDSPGSVLFKQSRIGENGQTFNMYKFRSMVKNAEALQTQVNHKDAEGNTIHKRRNDPRVTRMGRIIRKTSLDELPQLINVLLGDMSLVGPRPELPWLVEEEYRPWQHQRFAVPQGITGWWQVNGRADKPMHLNTDEDIYYIQNYSFWLDLKILFMTVPALLKGKGAF